MSDNLVKKLEESNRAKYGEKEFDQISENYRVSKEMGDQWTLENVKRYINRFKRPGSTKANNLTDLYKAKDYLERAIEANEKLQITTMEVVENFKENE